MTLYYRLGVVYVCMGDWEAFVFANPRFVALAMSTIHAVQIDTCMDGWIERYCIVDRIG